MGSVRTRKRGKSWEWSFEGAPIDGKRKTIQKGGYRTKAEALTAGTKAKAEYDTGGQAFVPSTISVADYMNYWLDTHVKATMEYTTYTNYKNYLKNHIIPAFGHYRLSSLKPENVQIWVHSLRDRGLARSSIKNLLGCLSGALQHAILPCGYINSNPCNGVKIGKIKEPTQQKEYREYVLPKEDFKRIIDRFDEHTNFFLPLQTGYNLGTRIGETYGIDLLNDIDFENHEIHINHQLVCENGVWLYRNPKYDSVRVLKMPYEFEMIIKRAIEKRKEIIRKYGEYYIKTYVDNNMNIIQLPASIKMTLKEVYPISVKENGELLTPQSFKYCARVIHYELGLPFFHYHCLRHTHGTILAENGAHPKTVMERLGHKNINTTFDRYVFNTDKMKENAVALFESAI